MNRAFKGTQARHAEQDVFVADRLEFRRDFDLSSFPVQHNLGNHLFNLPPRLLQLALETSRTRPHDLYHDAGNKQMGQRRNQTSKGLSETVDQPLHGTDPMRFLTSVRFLLSHGSDARATRVRSNLLKFSVL